MSSWDELQARLRPVREGLPVPKVIPTMPDKIIQILIGPYQWGLGTLRLTLTYDYWYRKR